MQSNIDKIDGSAIYEEILPDMPIATGDLFYPLPTASSQFCASNITKHLVIKLRDSQDQDLISQYLKKNFSEELQRKLNDYTDGDELSMSLQENLSDELNISLKKPLYNEEYFRDTILTENINDLLRQSLQGENLIPLNRLLLESAYPHEIAKSRTNYAGVVITPMCYLIQAKVEFVKLASSQCFRTYLQEIFIPQYLKNMPEYKNDLATRGEESVGSRFLEREKEREDVTTLRFVADLIKIVRNEKPIQECFYYLPSKDKSDRKNGFLVDFSHIFSLPYEKFVGKKPIMRLKSPWREQLLNRYVGYSLKVGTRNYEDETILETVRAFFPELEIEKIKNKMKKS